MTDLLGRRQRGRWLGRTTALIADQGINSATNILLIVLVARQSSLQQLGVFATTQLGVVLGQTVATAAIGERWLQADADQRPRRYAAAMNAYRVAAGVLVALALAAVPLVGLNAVFIGLAAVPAIAGLDHVRVVLFAEGRPWTALAMDALYGGLQLLGIAAWVLGDGWHGGAGAWLAWAAAAYLVFTAFAANIVRAQPRVQRSDQESVRSAVSLRYGAEMLVVGGGAQLAMLIASARLGVAFNGILRATSIPFGPLIVLLLASRALLMPSFRTADGRSGRRLLLGACAGYTLLWGLCTALAYFVTQTPGLRVLIGGIHPPPTFVLLTAQLFLTTGIHLLVYFYFRARQWDRPVLVSRGVLVTALAVGTGLSVLSGSSTVFLVLTSIAWVATTIAMVLARMAAPAPGPTS